MKVFILSSYHKGDICGDMQYKGVIEALNSEVSTHLTVEDFWLDSRHLSPEKLALKIKEAVSKIKTFKPFIIITIDDAAFKVALQNFLSKNGPPYIVFSGVNRPIKYYNREFHIFRGYIPIKNVTGVYEKIFSAEAIRFLDEWMKNINYNLAVVFSNDMVGNILKEQLIEEVNGTDLAQRVKFFKEVSSLSQLKIVLHSLQKNSSVKGYFPFVMSIKDDKTGRKISFTEAAKYLRRWIRKPDLFPNARGAAHLGLFGGVGTNFQLMGYQAGKMAAKIILGESIRKIPMEKAKNFEIVVNLKRAKECGLEPEDKLLNVADEVLK